MSIIYCSLQEHCKIGNKLQPAVFFLCWSFSILIWCVILCTYLLRNTRCEIALQVGKHFSVSETGLSTLQTALQRKLSENRQWGSEFAFPQLYSYMIPVGKVQSSHQTALTILLPVMAMGIELILQTKSCSFHKESNFKLYPVTRLFSNFEKGHLLLNLHHRSWIVSDKKGP